MLDAKCQEERIQEKLDSLAIWILKIAYGYINPPQTEINRIKNELNQIELFEKSNKIFFSKTLAKNNRIL